MRRSSIFVIGFAALNVVSLGPTVQATNIAPPHFVDPTGWTVGSENTTMAQWGATPTTIPITTDLLFSSNPTLPSPTLTEVSPGFVAGSGGLYSFSGDYKAAASISNFEAVPGAAGTRVLVQTASTLNPDFT